MKGTISILSLAMIPAPVFAQAANPQQAQADSNVGVADIVVTAQRREERLQDVPIAVTAITGNALQQRGISNTGELSQSVPGLVIGKSSTQVTPFLRGIGNPSVAPGSDPSVTIYVDGVLQQVPTSLIFSFNNIERVEVLKGPQGTLFGRNATGGLIQIVTRDPNEQARGDFSASYDNYNTLRTTAYVSGGTETVAADVSVFYNRQADGWGRNLFTPSQAGVVTFNGRPVTVPEVNPEVGQSKEFAIRSKVIVKPADRLTAKLAVQYSYINTNQGFYLDHLYGTRAVITQPGVTVPYTKTSGFYDVNQFFEPYSRSHSLQLSANIAQEFDTITLRSITAFTDAKSDNGTQSTAQPAVEPTAQVSILTVPNRAFTQELQILSNSGGRLEWIAGAYYLHWRTGYLPLNVVRGPNIDGGLRRESPIVNQSLSFFAQGTLALTERTKITGGLRYNFDRVASSQVFTGTSTATTPAPTATQVAGVLSNVVPTQKAHFGNLSYRLALDHHFDDRFMAYASISHGYKSGTFNTGNLCTSTFVGNCPAAAIAAPVEPETLQAYEIGTKTDILDRKVRLNVAAFYYKYKNLQVQTITGTPSLSLLQNAAQARSYGLDVEIEAKPTAFLTLNGGINLLSAKYSDFPNASINIPRTTVPYGEITTIVPNARGNYLSRAPKFTGTLGAHLDIPVGANKILADVSYYHNGGFYWEASNRLREKAYGIINVSTGYVMGDLRFSIWARNLGGTHYYTFQRTSAFGDGGSPGAPRTYGATVGWSFD